MSVKRTSAESGSDVQNIECSDSVFEQKDDAKRAKLSLLNDTKLQDLPTELLEDILIKAVLMEVNEMKLAKVVWKEKTDLVMARLASVCSRWTGILTNNFVKGIIHGILDGIAQEQIRLELLHHTTVKIFASYMTTLKDEVFVIWAEDYFNYSINVYDRNNMSVVKDVVPLPEICPIGFASCSVSNCLYLLQHKGKSQVSVLRISRDVQQHFHISTVIGDMLLPISTLSVTTSGDIILSRQPWEKRAVISVYNAAGSLQHEVKLPSEIYRLRQIIPKSNGNLVLVSFRKGQYRTKLTEMNLQGTFLRQYLPSLGRSMLVCQADLHGRLLLVEQRSFNIELIDSEFNPLNVTGLRSDEHDPTSLYYELHYSCEWNEILRLSVVGYPQEELTNIVTCTLRTMATE